MIPFVRAILPTLRDLPAATPARMMAYATILLVISILVVMYWVAFSHEGLDPMGKPLGTDFISFWTASKLALHGQPDKIYDPIAHLTEQAALFGPRASYAAFFYPPPYILICLPLALIGYLPALALWLTTTGLACWLVVRRFMMPSLSIAPLLAFPAVFGTLGHGQNAFLYTAIFGAGLLLTPARPILGGTLLGVLIFKPHVALLLPIWMLVTGRWSTFAAMAISAVVFCALSLIAFGPETWAAYGKLAPMAKLALEENWIGPEKMVSTFAAIRLLGGSVTASYVGHIIVAALTITTFIWAIHRRAMTITQQAALLASATPLLSPFFLDYDLMLLAIPLGWATTNAHTTLFRPFEKLILLCGYLLPGLARLIASSTGIPLGPVVLLAVFIMLVVRLTQSADVPAPNPLRRTRGRGSDQTQSTPSPPPSAPRRRSRAQ